MLRKSYIACIFLFLGAIAAYGQQADTDTIYNPAVIFSSMPRSYEIADIQVTGNDSYEDYIVIGYSGLKIGDIVDIPGNDITTAVKRLMRQGLFAQAQIKVTKTVGNKAWLEIALRTQPRISSVRYEGVKKSEREDLQERLNLMVGNQITQNIVNRAKTIIKGYFNGKGFGNADVKIDLIDDVSAPNSAIVNIAIDKHDKVKVHKIYIDGNEVLSDNQIQRAMKKTNEKN
ncbi:MAG: outer membrane protein assembly factor BamA, partial [Muribaculaceae bacterium]|nr:outer membrane protein assembly factor BamA [Muribaculaceae bacterium]